jgi:Matrixin
MMSLPTPLAYGLGILAAALVEAGCSSSPPNAAYHVTIDPTFTIDQRDSIDGALHDWEAGVGALHVTSVVGECNSFSPHDVCVQPAHDKPNPADDIVGMTNPGASGNVTVMLYVDRILAMGGDTQMLTRQTMAHEMGHVLGLGHSARGELMAARVSDQAHSVTPADVEEFWAVRGM